jgi:co-chaperonin GroES (HSP10)
LKLISLGPNVLAQPILTSARRGSLFLPWQKNTQEAVVVHPGEVANLVAGDRVIYRPYNIRGFDFAGEHYILLTKREIEAKVERDE